MTKTEICNLALSHLGVGLTLADVETENSESAQVCRTFFDTTRDIVLKDFSWTFATKFLDLVLIEEDPTSEYGYSFRYPNDCLKIRKILSGIRNDSRQSRIHYKIGQDADGKLIYCDEKEPCIEYTMRNDDYSEYPVDFAMALSFRLAYYICPRLTDSDAFEYKKQLLQDYQIELSSAHSNDRGEEQPEELPYSEFERARE
jgi:hypothetical protein